jgi:hypothetical protein
MSFHIHDIFVMKVLNCVFWVFFISKKLKLQFNGKLEKNNSIYDHEKLKQYSFNKKSKTTIVQIMICKKLKQYSFNKKSKTTIVQIMICKKLKQVNMIIMKENKTNQNINLIEHLESSYMHMMMMMMMLLLLLFSFS